MKQSPLKSRLVRILSWIGAVLGGQMRAATISLDVMMPRMKDVPSDLDYSTLLSSEKGLFNDSYSASTGKVAINQMHGGLCMSRPRMVRSWKLPPSPQTGRRTRYTSI